MRALFDFFDKKESPTLTLCTPSLEPVDILGGAYSIKNSLRFTSISDLSFKFPESPDNGKTIFPAYEKLQDKMTVLVEDVGYFIITSCIEDDTGKTPVKTVECRSLESRLLHIRLSGFSGTFKFYDYLSPEGTLLNIIMEMIPDWNLGHIDKEVLGRYRTFDISNTTIYGFLTKDASIAYNCVFIFDYMNKSVEIRSISSLGESSGVYLSQDNLSKSIALKENSDEIATCLYCFGGGDLTIQSVNPNGTNAIYDFTHYLDEKWMSKKMMDSISQWQEKLENLESPFYMALNSRKEAIEELYIENQNLISLQIILESYLTELEATQAISREGLSEGQINEIEHSILEIEEKIYAQRIAVNTQSENVFNALVKKTKGDVTFRSIVHSLRFTGELSWKTLRNEVKDLLENIYALETNYPVIYNAYSSNPLFDLNYYNYNVANVQAGYYNSRESVEKLFHHVSLDYANYWNMSDFDKKETRHLIQLSINNLTYFYDTISSIIPFTSISNKVYELISILEPYLKIVEYGDNFTQEEFLELQNYIFENTYSNENIIITDIMTTNEVSDQALELYYQGKEVLNRVSVPKYELTGDFVDFLSLLEYKEFTEKIDLGKLVTLELSSNRQVDLALLEVAFTYDDPSGTKLTFSNNVKLSRSNFVFADMFIDKMSGTSGVAGITSGQGTQITPVTKSMSLTGTSLMSLDHAIISKLGYISFGLEPPTTFGNHVGSWFGYSGGAKMSLYSSENDYLQWTGDKLLVKARNFTLDSLGKITATSAYLSGEIVAGRGNIAGWNITSGSLVSPENNSGIVSGSDYAFYAGGPSPETALFRVKHDGTLYASQAQISGSIVANVVEATSGSIGGWVISPSSLHTGTNETYVELNSASGCPVMIAGSSASSTAPFYITKEGDLFATSANIEGAVTAISGSIGGWKIHDTYLESDSGNVKLSSDTPSIALGATGFMSGSGLWVGKDDGEYKFFIGNDSQFVTWDGDKLSVSADFQSSNFIQGISGWRLDPSGNAEFHNVSVRGSLKSSVIEYSQVLALDGGFIAAKSAAVIAEDFTIGDVDIVVNLYIPDGVAKDEVDQYFVIDDVVRVKAGNTNLWGKIKDTDSTINMWYVTIEKVDPEGEVSILAGSTLFNYGSSGDGVIELSGHNPHIRMFTHLGAPYQEVSDFLIIGDLNGQFGYSNPTLGLGIGDPNLLGDYLIATDEGLRLSGEIKVGAQNHDTGVGFYVGKVTDTPYMRIGDPSGQHITWDGNSLNIVGNIVITGGSGASNLGGFGSLAFVNTISYGDISGEKPPINATYGAKWGDTLSNVPERFGSPPAAGEGLYISDEKMGYYSNQDWITYIDNTGAFHFKGTNNAYIEWDPDENKLYGYGGNRTQWYASAIDGRLYAGEGSVVLDEMGIRIIGDRSAFYFVDEDTPLSPIGTIRIADDVYDDKVIRIINGIDSSEDNLVVNPSFASNNTGWTRTTTGRVSPAPARSTENFYSSPASLRFVPYIAPRENILTETGSAIQTEGGQNITVFVPSNVPVFDQAYTASLISVIPSEEYLFTTKVFVPNKPYHDLKIILRFYNNAQSQTRERSVNLLGITKGDWDTVNDYFTTNEGEVYLRIEFRVDYGFGGDDSSPENLFIDDVGLFAISTFDSQIELGEGYVNLDADRINAKGSLYLPEVVPTTNWEATPKKYVDDSISGIVIPSDYVDLSNAQTIGGIKTFTSIPFLPDLEPNQNNHSVRKKYVDGLIDEYARKRAIMIVVFSKDEKVVSGNTLITFPAPFDCVLTGVKAMVSTASTSGGVVTRLRNNTTATYMLSTNITVDQTKVSSLASTVQPVISSGIITNDDIIRIDCTSAGTNAKGLILTLYVEME